MKYEIPNIEKMTVREKINQTIVIQTKKGGMVDFTPGAAFFFGQIITEADEAGLEELCGYVKDLNDKCDIPPLITSDFENGCGSMVKSLTSLPYMMGLGIELNEEECLKHPYVEHNLRHYTGALTDIRPAKTEFYF